MISPVSFKISGVSLGGFAVSPKANLSIKVDLRSSYKDNGGHVRAKNRIEFSVKSSI